MGTGQLTEKQKEWLEASKKIGPGPMTKSEKELLEKLYADMLPQEQQALYDYIQENFNIRDADSGDEAGPDDPIEKMRLRQWSEPSDKLRKSLGSFQTVKPPFDKD